MVKLLSMAGRGGAQADTTSRARVRCFISMGSQVDSIDRQEDVAGMARPGGAT